LAKEVCALADRRPPSVRARQLAAELRRLREAATLTGKQAASQLGWSSSKMSRIETGETAVSSEDLQRLLDLYRVSGSRGERLAELARTVGQRGWWDAHADILSDGYSALLQLEDEADAEFHFAPVALPGLLQTERYAREITRATLLMAPPGVIGRLTEVRLTRQQLLTRNPPLELVTVLDEGALRRVVGGPEVMREQLSHMTEIALRPNITIQVLPFTKGPHLGMSSTFTILKYPITVVPDVVYLENMAGDLIIESEAEVHSYTLAFDQLQELALGEGESSALITQIANEFR
jgi:transcriptional regulator with XRE-family HTH domain